MRTLFVKIFLWFWAAMALVVLAVAAATSVANMRREERLRREFDDPARVFAQMAARTYEREGQAGLSEYLSFLEGEARHRAWLFDAGGAEVLGRSAPSEVDGRARRMLRGEAQASGRPDARGLQAFAVSGPSGVRYLMVTRRLNPRRPPPWPEPRTVVLQLLAVLATAGLVCYWLARYLTAPVVRLSAATRRLADGDLSARVGGTGRRRDELAELGRDFDLMAGRIESLIQAQHRLLGDISHELRSPLARLSVALGVARRRAGEPAASAHDRIQRESERLNEMIGQLLTLTQLESGVDEVPPEPVGLSDLLGEVIVDADFEARGRERAVRLAAQAGCRLQGNRELLRSAIENVVRNAVRYTAPGTTVEVGLSHEQTAGLTRAVIRVRDHGPGVPPESLGEIFRPFYRVADARDRQSGGTGLGLTITERAVRVHGGSVSAENAPGGGLVVGLTLPCAGNHEALTAGS